MSGAQTELQGQLRETFGILNKTFVSIVGDVVNPVERSFLITVQGAGDQIGVCISERVRITDIHQRKPIGVVVGRLGIADPFPENAGL